MSTIILILLVCLFGEHACPQAKTTDSQAVEAHIRDIIKQLPPDSDLRRGLLQGARGKGTHFPWMDEMRRLGIRRMTIWIDISFDSKSRPKKLNVNRTEYFAEYEGGLPISNRTVLNAIRTSNLEQELGSLALDKARHGYWLDIPRPKPRPFVGGTHIDFLDDEWLPSLSTPVFYARAAR